jgi:hypothetical protein
VMGEYDLVCAFDVFLYLIDIVSKNLFSFSKH